MEDECLEDYERGFDNALDWIKSIIKNSIKLHDKDIMELYEIDELLEEKLKNEN